MTDRPTPDPYVAHCPSRALLEVIGDKWTLLLMPALAEGPKRNGELKRRIEGISQKMLTQTLRGLEENGLVRRIDFRQVPPRVEYQLTDLGRSLGVLVSQMDDWVVDNYYATIDAAGLRHDK